MILDGSNGVTFNDSSLQGAAASPYGLKNRIINGDMRIAQRGTSFSNPTAGFYTLDRWYIRTQNASIVSTITQSTTAPTGFVNSFYLSIGTGASSGSTDRAQLYQGIEGFNVADFGWGTANAQTVTLSFWARSSKTGQFGGSLQNNAGNRSYPFIYTISSANTWEQKSVTIAGDTSGTWTTDNTAGIQLNFDLGAGSSFLTTASSWASGDYRGATGDTSIVATTGATFYITGVQLEVGSTATPFERRMYGQELALCQRYFYKNKGDGAGSGPYGIGHCRSNYLRGLIHLPVVMRTTPTMTNTGTDADYIVTSGTSDFTSFVTRPSLDNGGNQILAFRVQVSTGMTNGYAALLSLNSSSSYLDFSAEL